MWSTIHTLERKYRSYIISKSSEDIGIIILVLFCVMLLCSYEYILITGYPWCKIMQNISHDHHCKQNKEALQSNIFNGYFFWYILCYVTLCFWISFNHWVTMTQGKTKYIMWSEIQLLQRK